jgi:hypothetical protein
VRHPLGCFVLSLLLAVPAYAQAPSARSWDDCLKAPDRACVLDEAMGITNAAGAVSVTLTNAEK